MLDDRDYELRRGWKKICESKETHEEKLEEKRYEDEEGFNSAAICHASLGSEPENSAKFDRCQKGVRRSYKQSPEERNKFRRTRRKAHKKAKQAVKKKEQVDEDVVQEDLLPGGLADDMGLKEIADKHGVDLEKIQDEFAMGVKVEFEHTDDEEKAAEIAKDHLLELPDYYTRLDKMENSAEMNEDSSPAVDPEIESIAQRYIDAYEADDEMSPEESIEDLQVDMEKDKSNVARFKTKLTPKIENWNIAWKNSNRSGKGGQAATSSVGSQHMPFNDFEEAYDIFMMDNDEKDNILIDIISNIGNIKNINVRAKERRAKGLREGQRRRVSPDAQYTPAGNPLSNTDPVHTSKGLTGSPFQRDDILRAAVFGHSEEEAEVSFNKLTNAMEKNRTIDWKHILNIGRNMNGPAGKFMQFLFFDYPPEDPMSRQFMEIVQLRKEAERAMKMLTARKKAIEHFEKESKMKEEVNPLMEGFRNWANFKRQRYS